MARRILPLLSEQHYRAEEHADLNDFILLSPNPRAPKLHFKVVRDELARAILFERNEADILLDSLSLTKTDYFKSKGAPIIESTGYHLSFLGFNLRSPILSDLRIRKAIASSLPIQEWIQYRFKNWVLPLSDFGISHNPSNAEKWLDEAGLRIQTDGWRTHLRYLTTPVREGNEVAALVREALKLVRIDVEIIPLETTLFFSRLKRGDFDLFGSRLMREHEDDPVDDYLRKGGSRNYFSNENPEFDQFIRRNGRATWNDAIRFVQADLPFFPYFTWKHGLLLSPRIKAMAEPILLDDSFRFLSGLQIK